MFSIIIIIIASFSLKSRVQVWIYLCRDGSLPMLIAEQELSVKLSPEAEHFC